MAIGLETPQPVVAGRGPHPLGTAGGSSCARGQFPGVPAAGGLAGAGAGGGAAGDQHCSGVALSAAGLPPRAACRPRRLQDSQPQGPEATDEPAGPGAGGCVRGSGTPTPPGPVDSKSRPWSGARVGAGHLLLAPRPAEPAWPVRGVQGRPGSFPVPPAGVVRALPVLTARVASRAPTQGKTPPPPPSSPVATGKRNWRPAASGRPSAWRRSSAETPAWRQGWQEELNTSGTPRLGRSTTRRAPEGRDAAAPGLRVAQLGPACGAWAPSPPNRDRGGGSRGPGGHAEGRTVGRARTAPCEAVKVAVDAGGGRRGRPSPCASSGAA